MASGYGNVRDLRRIERVGTDSTIYWSYGKVDSGVLAEEVYQIVVRSESFESAPQGLSIIPNRDVDECLRIS